MGDKIRICIVTSLFVIISLFFDLFKCQSITKSRTDSFNQIVFI